MVDKNRKNMKISSICSNETRFRSSNVGIILLPLNPTDLEQLNQKVFEFLLVFTRLQQRRCCLSQYHLLKYNNGVLVFISV